MNRRIPRGEACCDCICDHAHDADPTVVDGTGGRCAACKWCHCREHGRQARRDALAALEAAPAQPRSYRPDS